MAKQELNKMQSAMQRLRVSRNGKVTMLVVDGQGAACVPTEDFNVVSKWAMAKPAGPNANIDMGVLLEMLTTGIARPGTSFMGTRGSGKYVMDLAKLMVSAGFDIGEWNLPPDVKEELSGKPKKDDGKKKMRYSEEAGGMVEVKDDTPGTHS